MKEVRGTIMAVESEDHNGHEKKIVTLSMGRRELLYVEFRGHYSELVSKVMLKERVSIKVSFLGKKSTLGRRYNNIIGKSIKTI